MFRPRRRVIRALGWLLSAWSGFLSASPTAAQVEAEAAYPESIELRVTPGQEVMEVEAMLAFDRHVAGEEAAFRFPDLSAHEIRIVDPDGAERTMNAGSEASVLRVTFARRPTPDDLRYHFRWHRVRQPQTEVLAFEELFGGAGPETEWTVTLELGPRRPLSRFDELGYECDPGSGRCTAPSEANAVHLPQPAKLHDAKVEVGDTSDDALQLQLELQVSSETPGDTLTFAVPYGASDIEAVDREGRPVPIRRDADTVYFEAPPSSEPTTVVATYRQDARVEAGWLERELSAPGPTPFLLDELSIEPVTVERPTKEVARDLGLVGGLFLLFTVLFGLRHLGGRRMKNPEAGGVRQERSESGDQVDDRYVMYAGVKEILDTGPWIYFGTVAVAALVSFMADAILLWSPGLNAAPVLALLFLLVLFYYPGPAPRWIFISLQLLALIPVAAMYGYAMVEPAPDQATQLSVGAVVGTVLFIALTTIGRRRSRFAFGPDYYDS